MIKLHLASYFVAMISLLATSFDQARADQGPSGKFSTALASVADFYRIEISATNVQFPVRTTYGEINGERADDNALQLYVPIFVAEFTRYPRALVHRTRLSRDYSLGASPRF